jgi:hypothetical protein
MTDTLSFLVLKKKKKKKIGQLTVAHANNPSYLGD